MQTKFLLFFSFVVFAAFPMTALAADEACTNGDCRADYNGDGTVDDLDRELFQSAFNSEAGDGVYDAIFDHNGDGLIDGADFAAHVALQN